MYIKAIAFFIFCISPFLCIGQKKYLTFEYLEKRHVNSKWVSYKIGDKKPYTGFVVKLWDGQDAVQIKNYYKKGLLLKSEFYRLDQTLEKKITYSIKTSGKMLCWKYDDIGRIESKGHLLNDVKVGIWRYYKNGKLTKKEKHKPNITHQGLPDNSLKSIFNATEITTAQ